jgi:hypothetical protein
MNLRDELINLIRNRPQHPILHAYRQCLDAGLDPDEVVLACFRDLMKSEGELKRHLLSCLQAQGPTAIFVKPPLAAFPEVLESPSSGT